MIYLDNAATTKIDPEVLEAMMPYLTDEYGNPNAIYGFGRKAYDAIEKARTQVAEFIGAHPDQIIFTSGGSEANSMAVRGRNRYIITTQSEHASLLNAVKSTGCRVLYLKSNDAGQVSEFALKHELDDCPSLVSVMYINNETGAQNPIEDIGELCKRKGVLFHTDCVQAAGCFELDVDKFGCDFLSLSSHKIHGPKGAGALFVRNRHRYVVPIIYGSSQQEQGLRGGTQNVAAIVGFGQACYIAKRDFKDITTRISELKQIFYANLIAGLDRSRLLSICHINGPSPIKHGKVLNLRFDGIDSETLVLMAASKGVCISAGSACHGLEQAPSHVLLSMGLSEEEARSSVRISFSKMNTKEEVQTAAIVIAECIAAILSYKKDEI